MQGVVFLLVFVCATGGFFPGPVRADINFGHTESAREVIDKVDENVRDQQGLGSNQNSACMVDYPDWLSGVNSVADMRDELLVPDTSPSSALAVKNNADFDESADLTSDTIIQRCNTYFRDQNDNDIQHWIYCRAFQLPSGDTYTDLEALRTASDSDPPGLYTVAWFHGSNIDDPSENWMIPLVNQYQSGCHSRPMNVIWMGVRVTDQSQDPPEDLESLGNKWHVTSTSWDGTVLDQVMGESRLNFSAHTTASCPLDATPTHGLWPGGTAETEGRRITNKFTDDQALWVGAGSANQAACYSGIAAGNPVNANGLGVQLEYQATVAESSIEWVDPDDLAAYVLDEF